MSPKLLCALEFDKNLGCTGNKLPVKSAFSLLFVNLWVPAIIAFCDNFVKALIILFQGKK